MFLSSVNTDYFSFNDAYECSLKITDSRKLQLGTHSHTTETSNVTNPRKAPPHSPSPQKPHLPTSHPFYWHKVITNLS